MPTSKEKLPIFSLEDRFQFGNFYPAEVKQLAGVGNTKFYEDVKAGRVQVIKLGAASRVPGPSARAYNDASRNTGASAA